MLITLIAMASMAFPPAEMVMSIAPMASMPARQTYSPDEIKVDVRKEITERISSGFYVPRQDSFVIADAIVRNAKRYGVPVEMVLAVASTESAFRQSEVSSAGAIGVMQVLPSTAEFIARNLGVKEFDIHNVRTNIRFGTWYLKYLLSRYHYDYPSAIKSYNCGPGWMDHVIAGKGLLPRETRDYVVKVTETMTLVSNAMPYLVAEL
jgi:soluble lytic murein transglycosylase-like protein